MVVSSTGKRPSIANAISVPANLVIEDKDQIFARLMAQFIANNGKES